MNKEQQKYQFHIHGMHCKACVLMTESELKEFPYITDVKASLKSNQVEITGDFGGRLPEDIASELNGVLAKHGYTPFCRENREKSKLGRI